MRHSQKIFSLELLGHKAQAIHLYQYRDWNADKTPESLGFYVTVRARGDEIYANWFDEYVYTHETADAIALIKRAGHKAGLSEALIQCAVDSATEALGNPEHTAVLGPE